MDQQRGPGEREREGFHPEDAGGRQEVDAQWPGT